MMTESEIALARADIEATADLLLRAMMAAALRDAAFDWNEAERLANLPDFKVRESLLKLRKELSDGLA